MKAKTTWILVGNGSHAFIAENRGPARGVEAAPVREFHGENLASREIMSDAPGRTFDSAGQGGRHAMAWPTDPKRHNQQTFAREVAAYIDAAAARNGFDQLVLVAAPQFLGDLRKCLSAAAKSRIIGELAKDLTQVPRDKLPDHLGGVMAI